MKLGKGILISTIIAAVIVTYVLASKPKGTKQSSKSIDPQTADPELYKKEKFRLLPDGLNNYRSAQMSAKDLAYVIKKYGIKHIIRMNGDGRDAAGTSISTERQVCKDNGCELHFIDAHSGYVPGKGYTKSIANAQAILRKGNTLIHCAAGMDRTGYQVAAWLKDQGIMTDKEQLWNYTTQFNGWNDMLRKGKFYGSGYDKYADGFYPLAELKKRR